MTTKINIRDNKELMRFETGEGDDTAYLEYRFYKHINIAFDAHSCSRALKWQRHCLGAGWI